MYMPALAARVDIDRIDLSGIADFRFTSLEIVRSAVVVALIVHTRVVQSGIALSLESSC